MNAVPKTKPTKKPDRGRGAAAASKVRPATANGSNATQWWGSKDSAAAVPASAANALRASSLTAVLLGVERVVPNLLGAARASERDKSPDPSDRHRRLWLRRTLPLSTGRRALVRVPPRPRRADLREPRRPWFVVPEPGHAAAWTSARDDSLLD